MLDELDKQALAAFLEDKDEHHRDIIASKYKIDRMNQKIDIILEKVNRIENLLKKVPGNLPNDPVSRFMREGKF